MFKRTLMLLALACALALGLLAPGALINRMDGAPLEWEIARGETEYAYEGTLENRVYALEAWRNSSTGVTYKKLSDDMNWDAPDVWNLLHSEGLLPFAADRPEYEITRFSLFPARVEAEYRYLDISCLAGGGRLHVILDEHTRAYLQIDFTCEPQAFSDWMRDTGEGFNTVYKADTLINSYASALGLGRLVDLNYLDGEDIRGYESDIESVMFSVSMRYSLNQGLLMYGLHAKPLM